MHGLALIAHSILYRRARIVATQINDDKLTVFTQFANTSLRILNRLVFCVLSIPRPTDAYQLLFLSRRSFMYSEMLPCLLNQYSRRFNTILRICSLHPEVKQLPSLFETSYDWHAPLYDTEEELSHLNSHVLCIRGLSYVSTTHLYPLGISDNTLFEYIGFRPLGLQLLVLKLDKIDNQIQTCHVLDQITFHGENDSCVLLRQ